MDGPDPVTKALAAHAAMYEAAGGSMPVGRFVLEHGTAYAGTRFTGRRGTAKQCYRNALNLAQARGLRYAEGYALSGTLLKSGFAFPVDHAWCVDEEGRAVDPTWAEPETSFYLGVEFDPADAWARVARKGTFGMFHEGHAGTPDLDFIEALRARIAGAARAYP